MTTCGNDNDLCWGRTDPLTLLLRTFTNKEKEADKFILRSALAFLKDGNNNYNDNNPHSSLRRENITIDHTGKYNGDDSGKHSGNNNPSPLLSSLPLSSSSSSTGASSTITKTEEIFYTEVITLILKQLRNDGYKHIRLQNDGPNNEYESHIPTSTIARGIITGTLTGTINGKERLCTFPYYNTTGTTTVTKESIQPIKNTVDSTTIQDRMLVFPSMSRCTLRIGSEGCLYITGTKD